MSWLDPDSEGMLSATAGMADQVAQAAESFVPLEGLPDVSAIAAVAVMGMGGSAVAGEVLQAFSASRSAVPVVLLNDGEAPRWLGPRTLLFAVSFSGNTEETLSVTAGALAAGTPVVALSAGGELAEVVKAARLPHVVIGAAVPQPRAAAGATIAALLLSCEQLGLLTDARHELTLAVDQLRRRAASLEPGGGLSAEIARRIGRTIPVFHGAAGLAGVAARRWKTQVNENAKAPAYFGLQPEVCHNEVCGFGQHGDVTRQVMSLVNLRLGLESEIISRRIQIFAEMADEALAEIIDVEAEGVGELARFFDLVAVGDFVSLHMAAREGIDPGPVPALAEMKQRLASTS